MSFGEAIKSAFTQYVTFSGRASRSEFWWFFLFLVVANIVLQAVDAALQSTAGASGIGALFSLAVLLPYLAVSVRRLHDSGRSGWWLLGLAVAYVVGIVAVLIGALGGLFSALSDGMDEQSSSGGVTAGFIVLAAVGGLVLLGTLVMWIVQMTRASTTGPNAYGPHPLLPAAYPGAGQVGPYGGAPYGGSAPGPAPYGAPGTQSPWGPPPPPA